MLVFVTCTVAPARGEAATDNVSFHLKVLRKTKIGKKSCQTENFALRATNHLIFFQTKFVALLIDNLRATGLLKQYIIRNCYSNLLFLLELQNQTCTELYRT